MGIEKRYDEIAQCNHCGFCQVACPAFRTTGHEAGVARGRIALLRALVEGRVGWSRELEQPLFACLLCGACTANCFPAIGTADLIRDARGEYFDRMGRDGMYALLFDKLLPRPDRLRDAAFARAESGEPPEVAQALELLGIFRQERSGTEGASRRSRPKAFREQFPSGVVKGEGKLRLSYFVGCRTDILCPDAAEATLRLLRRIGKTVRILENCCCGLPAMNYGDRTAALRLAEKNLRLFEDADADVIVTDCSACADFLKKYASIFPEGDARRDAAAVHAARVRDVMELVAGAGNLTSAQPGERVIATFHDPCHASRGQGLVKEPREILRAIPGVEYRELPEASWCCGGAGASTASSDDLPQKVLDRKLDNVERTGANLLVTACPACVVHLARGARRRGLPIRVRHICQALSSADE